MRYLVLLLAVLRFTALQANYSYTTVVQKLETLIQEVETGHLAVPNALLSIEEKDMDFLIKPSVIDSQDMMTIATGRGVCTGAAQGVLCFNLNEVNALKQQNLSIIWVTDHIGNDDLCHLKDISGIFALKEDPSSHAVIVTRVSNIPCITLPQAVSRDGNKLITSSGEFREGDPVTLDAFNGVLLSGNMLIHHPENTKVLDTIMKWADEYADLDVHGNADTPEEARQALSFGAKGVDPRTEHMFFQPERLLLFRKVILSAGKEKGALDELENLQKNDFVDLYRTMQSYPVKIRLLDPPLHEFLPTKESSLVELSDAVGIPLDQLKAQVGSLSEVNPMMGHRGIRLLLTYPEILKMQARAIFRAVSELSIEGISIKPYIVIPMVIADQEMILAKKFIDEVRDEIEHANGIKISYHLGAMMETPRACLLAKSIAPYVDFVSFGTNDLTGQTLALSRGDVYEKFLKQYFEYGILHEDPFSNLDPAVCLLIKMTVEQMRLQNHPVSIGLCGEQGSEKTGVFLCHQLGLDTVSCSPYRVPCVKLFAAQAAILCKR